MDNLRDQITDAAATSEVFRPLQRVIDVSLDLSGEKLGHLDFRGVTFLAPVRFRSAHFTGLAWFDHANFAGAFDASYSTFDHDARFDRATFSGQACFIEAMFGCVATFDEAVLSNLCAFDRALCFGNLSFDRTVFNGPASMRDMECMCGVWFEKTQFSDVDLKGVMVHGRSFLRHTTSASAVLSPNSAFLTRAGSSAFWKLNVRVRTISRGRP